MLTIETRQSVSLVRFRHQTQAINHGARKQCDVRSAVEQQLNIGIDSRVRGFRSVTSATGAGGSNCSESYRGIGVGFDEVLPEISDLLWMSKLVQHPTSLRLQDENGEFLCHFAQDVVVDSALLSRLANFPIKAFYLVG